MPVTDTYERRSVDNLFVERSKRQRQDLFTEEGEFVNTDGLLESITERGVLSPILCTKGGQIIFGERRWIAAQMCGQDTVPVRYVEDLSAVELRVLELEENLRRRNLSWRDEVCAIAQLHEAYEELNGADWGQIHTAQALNIGSSQLTRVLRVYEELGSPKIANATAIQQAYNVLARQDERAAADIVEEIASGAFDVVSGPQAEALGSSHTGEGPDLWDGTGDPPLSHHASTSRADTPPILTTDFRAWAPTYSGPRFHLIHCDYPYGAARSAQANEQSNRPTAPYEDTEELYYELIETLCANLHKLMASSGHLIFWCNADHSVQVNTRARFRELAPSLVFWERPLIWHKTDNVGVLADPSRYARYCYETALVASQEDRKIIKAVANCYGAPTDKRWHPSTKPEPMLRHFFQMFVEQGTRVFDPTCGSAASLRAAESLGATTVLGLEVNQEHAQNALTAMRQFRSLRAVA